MRDSSLALPTAIALTVVTPVFIGVVSEPSETPSATEADAPASASLSVTEDLAPWDSSTTHLLLLAAGPAPTSGILVSASGEHRVRVAKAANADDCEGEPERSTSLGENEWCLELSGLSAGQQVAGALTGTSSKVTLTVATRSALLPWPLLAALIGMALAIILTMVVAPLGKVVAIAKLRKLVAENQPAGNQDRIEGLPAWVDARLTAGGDPEKLTAQVQGLLNDPSGKVAAILAKLNQEAGDAQQGEAPLRTRARAVAADPTLRISDFVDADGKPVTHPAQTLTVMVAALNAATARLETVEKRIEQALKERCRAGPQQLAEWARAAAATVDDDATLALLQSTVTSAEAALYQMLSRPECLEPGGAPAGGGPDRRDMVEEEPAAAAAAGAATANLRIPWLWTLATVAAMVVVALTSVVVGTYLPKTYFGTAWDYVAMALAGFGSGSAATVAAVLALWRDSPMPVTEEI
jgi:hypothetical protein